MSNKPSPVGQRIPLRSISRKASVLHATRGVLHLVQTQPNARVHVLATLVTVVLGVWLGISPMEWALLALAVGLVLCAEALNTAIEHVVDLVSPEWHPLARDAKDVAAAAVLLASVAALGVGAAMFGTRLWALLLHPHIIGFVA